MNKDELLSRATGMHMVHADEWRERAAATSDQGVLDLINGAEQWARMMQVCIADGMTVAEAADATYELSWLWGTSGHAAMHAVLLLVHHWTHGRELQRWHNRRHGVPESDDHRGVVDPTVIVARCSS